MKKIYFVLAVVIILGMLFSLFYINKKASVSKNIKIGERIIESDFIIYKPDLEKSEIKMYWKSDDGNAYKDIKNFISKSSGKKLLFVTNGGIYTENYTPEGLYIENYKLISELNLKNEAGNFYMKPNGVFYIEDGKPKISDSEEFQYNKNISYAVQSGPLLIKNGEINKEFSDNSKSFKIRSAVGLDDQNKVFFYMSRKEMSFYEFSKYAKDNLRCRQLLFLDGTISKMYFSEDRNIPTQKYPFVTIISIEERI